MDPMTITETIITMIQVKLSPFELGELVGVGVKSGVVVSKSSNCLSLYKLASVFSKKKPNKNNIIL